MNSMEQLMELRSSQMDELEITAEEFLPKKKEKKSLSVLINCVIESFETREIDNELYVFDGVFWESDVKIIKNTLRRELLKIYPNVTTYDINEVYESVKVLSVTTKKHENAIAFKNCIYCFDTKTKLKNNSLIPAFKIKRNLLDSEEVDEIFEEEFFKLFEKITKNDKTLINSLMELLSDIIEPKRKNQKIIFQFGETANNGKSTLNSIITNAIGIENVSNVPIHKIADKSDKFATSSMANKLVNFDDDMTADFLSGENFKTITGGSQVRVEKKGKDAYDTKINATIVANCNKLPSFDFNDAGVLRRISIIPFLNTMNDAPEVWDKLEKIYFSDKFAEILIFLAIEKNKLCNGKISDSEIGDKYKINAQKNKVDELEFYEELMEIIENDKEARDFLLLNEAVKFDIKEPLIKKTVFYNAYKNWAKDAGVRYINKRTEVINILEKHKKIEEVRYTKTDGKYEKGTRYLKVKK